MVRMTNYLVVSLFQICVLVKVRIFPPTQFKLTRSYCLDSIFETHKNIHLIGIGSPTPVHCPISFLLTVAVVAAVVLIVDGKDRNGFTNFSAPMTFDG